MFLVLILFLSGLFLLKEQWVRKKEKQKQQQQSPWAYSSLLIRDCGGEKQPAPPCHLCRQLGSQGCTGLPEIQLALISPRITLLFSSLISINEGPKYWVCVAQPFVLGKGWWILGGLEPETCGSWESLAGTILWATWVPSVFSGLVREHSQSKGLLAEAGFTWGWNECQAGSQQHFLDNEDQIVFGGSYAQKKNFTTFKTLSWQHIHRWATTQTPGGGERQKCFHQQLPSVQAGYPTHSSFAHFQCCYMHSLGHV